MTVISYNIKKKSYENVKKFIIIFEPYPKSIKRQFLFLYLGAHNTRY